MRTAAAIPALALMAGAALGLVAPNSRSITALCWLAIAASAAAAVRAWRTERAALLIAGVVGGFLAGGVLLAEHAWLHAWRPTLRAVFDELAREQRAEFAASGRSFAEDQTAIATVTGVLTADASASISGASLSVAATRLDAPEPRPVEGGALVTVVGEIARDRLGEWRAGRTVRFPAQLRRPARYLDPGVPDEERAMARRGTVLVGTVKSGALVEVLARGGPLDEGASAVRAFARGAIAAAVGRWSSRASAIVVAIVIGDRAGLEEHVQRRLQEAGTYHVIAISGGNIAILAGLTLGVFRLVGMLGAGAALSAMLGLVAYAFLVGGGASVDRATLMAVVYFAGRAIDLRGSPPNTLAVVAGLLVAAEPLAVADPAFLLTVGATGAILLVVPFVPVGRFPRFIQPLLPMVVASAAAEAALFPVAAAFFGRVTFAGLLFNFAAIPLMAVTQVAGMLLVSVATVSSRLALKIGWVAFVGAEGLVRSAELVKFTPALTWRVGPPSGVSIAFYYAAAASACWLWRRSTARVRPGQDPVALKLLRHAAVGAACVCAAWIGLEPWRWLAARGDGRLHVTFIDVGQGDSALIQLPGGTAAVVDTGGLSAASSFDMGDRVVAPVLRRAGIRNLAILALTHGDADHIGGAPAIIEEFKPHDIWEGIPVPPFEPLAALRASARTVRARWTNVQTGDVTSLDDVDIVVRHPRRPDWERQKVRNDDSVVLEFVWRGVSVVLTGDIGREAEQTLAAQFAHVPHRIVKVPHHGSATSSSEAFVRGLAPRIAVVSVGRSNPFGHPSPLVLDRYQAAGAEVFRTDRDGAVTIETDGHSLNVQTVAGRTLTIE